MIRAEWIDKERGMAICGRCAAEAGLIYTDKNGEWHGLEPYDGEYGCWSCHQMIDEENIIE